MAGANSPILKMYEGRRQNLYSLNFIIIELTIIRFVTFLFILKLLNSASSFSETLSTGWFTCFG